MTRTPDFYYQNPVGDIGSSLVRAILGDPEMAAKQAQQRAEMDRLAAQAEASRAAAGFDVSRTTGQNTSNTAQNAAPASMERWLRSIGPPPPRPSVDSAAFGDFDTPLAMPAPLPDKTSSLAALVGVLSQMNPNADPTKIMGSLAAFGGGDELARRGIVAQGGSPTDDFAITSGRADEIAGRDAAASQRQAFGVADINRRSAFDVAGVNNASDIPVARIAADSRRDVAGIKAAGAAPGFDAITNAFPGVAMNSGVRSVEHNRAVGGVENSTHLGNRPGVQGYDFDAIPGVSIEQAAAQVEAANPGVKVVEMRDERGRVGPNGKALGGYHLALANVGGKPGKAPAAAKLPNPITKSEAQLIQGALRTFLENRNMTIAPQLEETILARAVTNFQQSGNPVEAVAKAAARLQKATKDAPRAAPATGGWGKATVVGAPPVEGARKAPDGNWYVATGKKPDGSPSYSKVEAARPTVTNW